MNKIMLMGRMVVDPELRTTPQGITLANFRIAVDRNRKNDDGSRDTDFFQCTAWRQTGEFVVNYFHKGDGIAIEGQMHTRDYIDSKSGQKRQTYEVTVEKVEFPLAPRNAQGTQAPKKPAERAPAAPARGNAGQDIIAAAQAQGLSVGTVSSWEPLDDETDLPF